MQLQGVQLSNIAAALHDDRLRLSEDWVVVLRRYPDLQSQVVAFRKVYREQLLLAEVIQQCKLFFNGTDFGN
jgi:hypothetical protein